MKNTPRYYLALLVAMLLFAPVFLIACGDAAPTATIVPPAATATAVPTATPIPPTATATPLPPTATPLPPTATPLPPTATLRLATPTPAPTVTPRPTPTVQAAAVSASGGVPLMIKSLEKDGCWKFSPVADYSAPSYDVAALCRDAVLKAEVRRGIVEHGTITAIVSDTSSSDYYSKIGAGIGILSVAVAYGGNEDDIKQIPSMLLKSLDKSPQLVTVHDSVYGDKLAVLKLNLDAGLLTFEIGPS